MQPGMSSPQTRDFGADAAAGWQQSTYASKGYFPNNCSGPARKPGYVDPSIDGVGYMAPMSHGDGSQGVHSASAPGSEPTVETAEFAGGQYGDTTGGYGAV